MRFFDETISGIDGTGDAEARFRGYVIDNSEEMDPARVRPAVLILPGGGYRRTSEREAEPIALKMLGYGYQAFILDYACAPAQYPVALLQTAEAMRRIRAHAAEWHVDPDAIVIGGFSAGGHAAAFFCERWNGDELRSRGFEPQEIRPNGLMLGYPVITSGPFAHRGSIDNLLGPARRDDPQWLDYVSLERHASADVPPTFIWSTVTDRDVPVQNSLLFANALIGAGVNVELHIFPEGNHGSSLGTRETDNPGHWIGDLTCVQVWPDLFDAWVRGRFPAATAWK
ncbi:alpha/beta hydrolase [Bifidobacterium avesanii]|uniref:Alpha/beta hydrolase fold domain-containing protein n=1 Tax=Bifidobacterium avesanii TaxID=1798157 RepID=A0A7K3TIE5_9BIFI|nr:alpha/beta hydrolase [Bifidobacterium avesanii]KAB8292772.1 acetylesterase [Bifidobacterium avesanii]NEG78380.1 alpha/beta hydrolase fold domain-containing protein [Bifidobacterium avesanii]